MIEVDRFHLSDRPALDALHRRVFGEDAAASFHARWQWANLQNPNSQDPEPPIWLLRDGEAIVGHYATMPVRLMVNGSEIKAAWGMDFMVAPEHQRKGLGVVLLGASDSYFDATLELSMTDSSHALFQKLKWTDMGRVPRLAKPLSRGLRKAWKERETPLGMLRSALQQVWPLPREIRPISHFGEGVTRLWDRVQSKFAFAVRRDAAYLNWKFVDVPGLQYSMAAFVEDGETKGYLVLRHEDEEKRRVTSVVDFLADPDEPHTLAALLRWAERKAREGGSALIRTCTPNKAFATVLRRSGYLDRTASLRYVVKINALSLPSSFYEDSSRWHVTLGDSDIDR